MIVFSLTFSDVILEIIITTKDEILIFEHQFDYLGNEFEPSIDKLQLFQKERCHKYRDRQIVLIVQLIGKDLVQKQLHVHLNNKFIKLIFF
jgi:hypothetical protein